MFKLFSAVVALGLAVFCLVQVVQTRGQQVRVLPRWAWVLVIVLLPLLGPIGWLVLGQPRRGRPPTQSQRRTIAPDDDPDFLRRLNRRLRQDPKDE